MALHDATSLANRGQQQANVAIAFLVLAWVFLALRIFTRTYVIANFGWDDSTILCAGILFTVYCSAMLYIEANGGGTHITSVAELVALTKWAIVGEATYIVTMMMLKISLGVFFARIVVKAWHLWTIYVNVALTIVSSTASFFYVLLRCGANLDIYVYKQLQNQCTPRGLDRFFAYQQAAVTTLTDCVFAVLPIFILWNASMNKRSKISVGLVLSLAALGSICSAVRFRYVDGLTQIEDFFWNATNIAIWSTIEPGAGIIAGCLATLRPFLRGFIVKARSIRSSTSQSTKTVFGTDRSTDNSSNRKDITGSYVQQHTLGRTDQANSASEYDQHNQTYELKSDISRNGGSTDCILARIDTHGPLQHELSLELDRQSSCTNSSTRNLQPNLNRRANDAELRDRPLPPIPAIPQQSKHRDLEMG